MERYFKLLLPLLFAITISTQGFSAFYSPDSWPEVFANQSITKNLPQVMKSHFKIRIGAQSCSGFFVSPYGHFLTSLHCIDICLFKTKHLVSSGQEGVPIDMSFRQGGGRVSETCDLVSIPELKFSGAEILAIGRGFANFDDFSVSRFSTETRNKLQTLMFEDYALLRFTVDGHADIWPVILNPDFHQSDRVWMAGFPTSTLRPEGRGSNGVNLYLSPGFIHQEIESNEYFKLFAPEDPVFWDFHHQWVKGFWLSDVDSSFGASGGSWLNDDGEVIALNAGIIGPGPKQNQERYYASVSMAIPIQKILELLRQQLSAEEMGRIFQTID